MREDTISYKYYFIGILLSMMLLLGACKKNNPRKVKIKRHVTVECPDFDQNSSPSRRKIQKIIDKNVRDHTVKLIPVTSSLRFETIDLENKKLDIPEFKQFKNNRSEFTADGKEQFDRIIQTLYDYLGEGSDGDGATIKIVGSASQIPTSYHPNKPNYGLNPDGSSITGETSIENNVFLAHDRAMTLAYSIKEVFPFLEVVTPELEEIELGPTEWTMDVREKLYYAKLRGDEEEVKRIYAPYQKEQFVKIESQDVFAKRIKPDIIRSYSVAAIPRFKQTVNGKEEIIKSAFVISKQTYELFKKTNKFTNVETRDAFLQNNGLQIMSTDIADEKRWYIVSSSEEIDAINIQGDDEKILAMYQVGLLNFKDRELVRNALIQYYIKEDKFTYVVNSKEY
ncbi:MAG: hypothetical protein GY827_03570 [Cytophagales bacterium]|nr:hypothetical protein [Cytophagales bacterium]